MVDHTNAAVATSAAAMMTWVIVSAEQVHKRGVKKDEKAVPPMPAPKTPVAKPRRDFSYQALTNGIPTANVVRRSPGRSRTPAAADRSPCAGERHQQDEGRGQRQQHGEHDATAEPVQRRRPGSVRQTPRSRAWRRRATSASPRARSPRCRGHEQRDDVPGPEAHREGQRGQGEVPRLSLLRSTVASPVLLMGAPLGPAGQRPGPGCRRASSPVGSPVSRRHGAGRDCDRRCRAGTGSAPGR